MAFWIAPSTLFCLYFIVHMNLKCWELHHGHIASSPLAARHFPLALLLLILSLLRMESMSTTSGRPLTNSSMAVHFVGSRHLVLLCKFHTCLATLI